MFALLVSTSLCLKAPLPRRTAVVSGLTALAAGPMQGRAAVVAPGFETVAPRIEGIGGGADLLTASLPAAADALFPPSLNGTWVCKRTVLSVEGDTAQAQGAWRLLGGTGDIAKPETFDLRYVVQPADSMIPPEPITGLDGRKYFGTILDRGYEMASRTGGADVTWDPRAPDTLAYQRSSGGRGASAELKVVERKIELPSEQGWGSNELVRVTTASNVLGSSFDILYAARVRRRWRRATTESGARVVEGLEIVTTYRVLDGVAGVEYPTSTTKSTLRLTRPQVSSTP